MDEIIPPETGRWSSIVVTSPAGPVSLLQVPQQRNLGPAYEHRKWGLLVFGVRSAHRDVAYICAYQ